MMRSPSQETIQLLRDAFPAGCRVELDYMNDPYNRKLTPGCKGTVRFVDDMGTIFVSWDCGSGLGVAYGEDRCHRIDE